MKWCACTYLVALDLALLSSNHLLQSVPLCLHVTALHVHRIAVTDTRLQCTQLRTCCLQSIGHESEECEANLLVRVLFDALLYDWSHLIQPVLARARAEVDGPFLQAIELVQHAIHGHVADEVECIFGFAIVLFDHEGFLPARSASDVLLS